MESLLSQQLLPKMGGPSQFQSFSWVLPGWPGRKQIRFSRGALASHDWMKVSMTKS